MVDQRNIEKVYCMTPTLPKITFKTFKISKILFSSLLEKLSKRLILISALEIKKNTLRVLLVVIQINNKYCLQLKN